MIKIISAFKSNIRSYVVFLQTLLKWQISYRKIIEKTQEINSNIFIKFIYTIKLISEETLGVVMAKHGFTGEESEM